MARAFVLFLSTKEKGKDKKKGGGKKHEKALFSSLEEAVSTSKSPKM